MGGFVDFFRLVWRWLSSPGGAAVPVRKLSLTGRDETALALAGRVETALSLVGSVTVSRLPQSLSCVYGEAIEIEVRMDSPPAGGVAGWTMGFWVKKAQGLEPPAPVVTKVSGAGIVATDDVAAVWLITLASVDTKQTPTTYYVDFWRTDPGEETAVAQGRLSIGDTTRP